MQHELGAKKAPPCERGQLVAYRLGRAQLPRQPPPVVSVGALYLRALRSGALVPRAGDGELLDGAPNDAGRAGDVLGQRWEGKQ